MDNPYRKPYKIEIPQQPPKITPIDVNSPLQRWKDKRFRYWTLLTVAAILALIGIKYNFPPISVLLVYAAFEERPGKRPKE